MDDNDSLGFSPLARLVYRLLWIAPGTADELAQESLIAVALIIEGLIELRKAGRATEIEPGRWRAR